jgi:hypothetical protein
VTELWLKLIATQQRVLARSGEVPVDSEIASERTYSVINRGLGHQPSLRDRAEWQATVRLSRIASLTLITLLSVGLWAAIWVAASSLAAVWLR